MEVKVTSNEQKVMSNKQKLTSNEQKLTSNEQKLTSKEQKIQPHPCVYNFYFQLYFRLGHYLFSLIKQRMSHSFEKHS